MPQAITATITLDASAMRALLAQCPVDRQAAMVDKYGEACSKAQAAKIINASPPTITAMLEDGRIRYACGGERVDVRSLADYIDNRGAEDHAARMRRKGRKVFV